MKQETFREMGNIVLSLEETPGDNRIIVENGVIMIKNLSVSLAIVREHVQEEYITCTRFEKRVLLFVERDLKSLGIKFPKWYNDAEYVYVVVPDYFWEFDCNTFDPLISMGVARFQQNGKNYILKDTSQEVSIDDEDEDEVVKLVFWDKEGEYHSIPNDNFNGLAKAIGGIKV